MGASSIAWIGKMKTHLRRLRPKNGRATNNVLIMERKKGDVLGNDLKSALRHLVSFFYNKINNIEYIHYELSMMERHLEKTN